MLIPVDVKAVIDEATKIDAARLTPLSVSMYIDKSAPEDLQALVRQAFASASPHAGVSIAYFPQFPVPSSDADMAVIVAGLNENIGHFAANIRRAGVPVMIVTTLPKLVCAISREGGEELLEKDLLSPNLSLSSSLPIITEKHAMQLEPLEPSILTKGLSEALLKRMGEWVLTACHDKRLAFALAFPFVRKPLSLEAVSATSVQNAGIGLVVFIPGADMPIMTLNQAKMLLQIAAAYGQAMSLERAKELAVVVGGAFVFRACARQLLAFVPILGWAIKAAIGYTGTYVMGQAAIEYFEDGGSIKGLVGVVAKAREGAIKTAAAVHDQSGAKVLAQSLKAHAASALEVTVKKTAPRASSLVVAALETAKRSK